jgi:hypothetical protein
MKKTSINDLSTTRRDAIKGGLGAASLTALGGSMAAPVAITTVAIATTAKAEQPSYDIDVTEPATGIVMFPDYARTIAQFAYVWGWPMVNMINRRTAITQAPQPGLLNGVLPVAPRGQLGMLHDYIEPSETFVTCPNQDVVYGLGFFSLDEEPVVIQVPDFGDRFWVYALYSTHRPVRSARQALRFEARILSARRSELERSQAERHNGDHPLLHVTRQRHPACVPGRHARRQEGYPSGDQPDCRLSAQGFHRQDEDN